VIIVYLAIIQLVGRAASIGLDADYAAPHTTEQVWRTMTIGIALSLYDDGGGVITLRVTGEFRGNRVRGIARAKERGLGGLVCTGKRRFTARRTEG
jgi:hypothetical protein